MYQHNALSSLCPCLCTSEIGFQSPQFKSPCKARLTQAARIHVVRIPGPRIPRAPLCPGAVKDVSMIWKRPYRPGIDSPRASVTAFAAYNVWMFALHMSEEYRNTPSWSGMYLTWLTCLEIYQEMPKNIINVSRTVYSRTEGPLPNDVCLKLALIVWIGRAALTDKSLGRKMVSVMKDLQLWYEGSSALVRRILAWTNDPPKREPKGGSGKRVTLKWLKSDVYVIFWSDAPFRIPLWGTVISKIARAEAEAGLPWNTGELAKILRMFTSTLKSKKNNVEVKKICSTLNPRRYAKDISTLKSKKQRARKDLASSISMLQRKSPRQPCKLSCYVSQRWVIYIYLSLSLSLYIYIYIYIHTYIYPLYVYVYV